MNHIFYPTTHRPLREEDLKPGTFVWDKERLVPGIIIRYHPQFTVIIVRLFCGSMREVPHTWEFMQQPELNPNGPPLYHMEGSDPRLPPYLEQLHEEILMVLATEETKVSLLKGHAAFVAKYLPQPTQPPAPPRPPMLPLFISRFFAGFWASPAK